MPDGLIMMKHFSSKTSVKYQSLCIECQTGVLRSKRLTYFTWFNEELVTVPNFPAWVCDVCGRREYDSKAIVWLNTLLNHEAGKPDNYRRKIDANQAHSAQT